MMKKRKKHMGKSCSKIILLILILAAWIVVTVRAKKTEEGIILTDAYKKQIMVEEDIFTYRKLSGYSFRGFKKKSGNAGICRRIQ